MSFNPRNTSVLDPFNATIPFQGTFDEDDLCEYNYRLQ